MIGDLLLDELHSAREKKTGIPNVKMASLTSISDTFTMKL